jgi:predicted site-specific integrase-resolvase
MGRHTVQPARDRWYSATDTAKMLGYKSTEALRLLRVSGKIRAEIMPNGRWGFPETEINRLLHPVNMESYISNLCKNKRL